MVRSLWASFNFCLDHSPGVPINIILETTGMHFFLVLFDMTDQHQRNVQEGTIINKDSK